LYNYFSLLLYARPSANFARKTWHSSTAQYIGAAQRSDGSFGTRQWWLELAQSPSKHGKICTIHLYVYTTKRHTERVATELPRLFDPHSDVTHDLDQIYDIGRTGANRVPQETSDSAMCLPQLGKKSHHYRNVRSMRLPPIELHQLQMVLEIPAAKACALNV